MTSSRHSSWPSSCGRLLGRLLRPAGRPTSRSQPRRRPPVVSPAGPASVASSGAGVSAVWRPAAGRRGDRRRLEEHGRRTVSRHLSASASPHWGASALVGGLRGRGGLREAFAEVFFLRSSPFAAGPGLPGRRVADRGLDSAGRRARRRRRSRAGHVAAFFAAFFAGAFWRGAFSAAVFFAAAFLAGAFLAAEPSWQRFFAGLSAGSAVGWSRLLGPGGRRPAWCIFLAPGAGAPGGPTPSARELRTGDAKPSGGGDSLPHCVTDGASCTCRGRRAWDAGGSLSPIHRAASRSGVARAVRRAVPLGAAVDRRRTSSGRPERGARCDHGGIARSAAPEDDTAHRTDAKGGPRSPRPLVEGSWHSRVSSGAARQSRPATGAQAASTSSGRTAGSGAAARGQTASGLPGWADSDTTAPAVELAQPLRHPLHRDGLGAEERVDRGAWQRWRPRRDRQASGWRPAGPPARPPELHHLEQRRRGPSGGLPRAAARHPGSTTSAGRSRYSRPAGRPGGGGTGVGRCGVGVEARQSTPSGRARDDGGSKARLKSRWLVNGAAPLGEADPAAAGRGACCSGWAHAGRTSGPRAPSVRSATACFIAVEGRPCSR